MNEKYTVTEIANVIYVRDTSDQPRKVNFPSNLKFNELILQMGGNIVIELGNSRIITKDGSIRFMQNGEHNRYYVERVECGGYIDIFFRTKEDLGKELIVINDIANTKIRATFKKIFNLWVQKEQGYYVKCMALLYELLDCVLTNSYVPSTKKEKIMPAIDYIQQNYFKEIKCEELAQMCNMSYSYLKRLFAEVYGVSPQKYILSLKINSACGMLETEMFSVSQVAEQCGFSDITYFSRMFKKYVGVSPRAYGSNLRHD